MTVKTIILFIFLCINSVLSSNIEVIIILGCSDNQIQRQRVNAGIKYIKETNNSNKSNIIYISGGIKNNLISKTTEASQMLNQIENEKLDIPIIIDNKAQNTAENFMYLKEWINKNYMDNLYSFVIVTSDFHQRRTLMLFNGIFNDIQPKWVLSKSECISCWNNENIHIQNVEADIQNALLL
jgi:hypothetical protein